MDKGQPLSIIRVSLERKAIHLCLIFSLLSACLAVEEEDSPTGSVTQKEKDVSGKMALALGGVASSRGLLSLDESPNSLEFTTDDEELLEVSIPEGFGSFVEAGAAEIQPLAVGVGYVTPVVNTRERDPVKVTIPPQKLVQILMGEARGQLVREATMEDDGSVKASSVSVTGDALGAVVRNRIELINDAENPGLFKADPARYEGDPPASYYDAVIEGGDGVNFQFSPVDPSDRTHEIYLAAVRREEIDDEDDLIAYDQGVLTAADIFNDDTKDPTGGSFAFYTPDEAEYEALQEALSTGTTSLPVGAGTSDARYPSLAPIQVLIIPGIASVTSRDDRPAFVFVRERNELDPAVTDTP